MEIMEIAALLGRTIKEDERIKTLNRISEQYEQNSDIQSKVTEYNAHSAALAEEYKKDARDEEIIRVIETRMKTLYDEISADPIMLEYEQARAAVTKLMDDVNSEIMFHVTGTRPCSHDDCSSCGASCGHHHG